MKKRIGFLLDSYESEAWMYEAIRQVGKNEDAEVVLVVLNASGSIHKSKLSRLLNNSNKIVHQVYTVLDRLFLKVQPNARNIVNMSDLLHDVDILECKPNRTKFVDRFTKEDIEKIKKYNLDILVRFGFRFLKGEILNVAKFGLWSFHHGDNDLNRGGPPGYWEVAEKWPVTGSILQILNEELDGGTVLFKTWSSTNLYSAHLNLNQALWKSASFLSRGISQLSRLGEDKFRNFIFESKKKNEIYYNKLYKTPSNITAFWQISRIGMRIVRRFFQKIIYIDQWTLYFTFNQKNKIFLKNFKKITPPKDRFWADPQIVYHENKYYVFLEEYLFSTKHAHISVMEIEKNGKYTTPVPVIKCDYHLSYPTIIKEDGVYYMIPESSGNNTIELYRCNNFPYEWEHVIHLMEDVFAVDSTVIKNNDMWWLFTSMTEVEGSSPHDELFLFYSDKLITNDWKPHSLNPIISDTRTARPAGAILEDSEGQLLRPSQDCSLTYGYAINFNRIETMSPDEYKERKVGKIKPNWEDNLVGTHSYTQVGDLIIVDALIKRKRFF